MKYRWQDWIIDTRLKFQKHLCYENMAEVPSHKVAVDAHTIFQWWYYAKYLYSMNDSSEDSDAINVANAETEIFNMMIPSSCRTLL